MMMRPNCLLLLLLLLSPFLFAASNSLLAFGDHSEMSPGRIIDLSEAGEEYPGMGPQRVDVNDEHLKVIAEFAVSEFNKESLKSLVFQKVVSGLYQLVEGDLYTLVIAVRDESLPASPIVNYRCRVIEKVWMNDKLTLRSFHRVYYDTFIEMWD